MKRILFASITIFSTLFFAACGDQGAGNKPANAANTANTANTANANSAGNAAAAEADIKKLMDSAAAALAKNDADAMDKIYGENYMLVNIDGSVQNRTERLAALRSGDAKYTAFSYSDANIRLNPEATGAVVIVKLAMKGTNKGKAVEGDYRVTQVYSKTKDGWKQVSAQATKIEAAADAKPASTNTAAANTAGNAAKPPPPANK